MSWGGKAWEGFAGHGQELHRLSSERGRVLLRGGGKSPAISGFFCCHNARCPRTFLPSVFQKPRLVRSKSCCPSDIENILDNDHMELIGDFSKVWGPSFPWKLAARTKWLWIPQARAEGSGFSPWSISG